jgi:hypothetical protein
MNKDGCAVGILESRALQGQQNFAPLKHADFSAKLVAIS